MEDVLNPENLEAFAKLAFEAAKTGNAWMLVSLGLILAVYLVRKFLGPKVPFLQTQAGGAILNLVMAFAGAIASALIAGQSMNPLLAVAAFKVAFTAAGGFTLVKHLLTLFKGKNPEQIKAAGERLLVLFNQSDYKSPSSVREAFTFNWQYVSFSTPGKLRDVSPALFEAEQQKAAQKWAEATNVIEQVLRTQMRDLVDRLREVLSERPLLPLLIER
jgi:hypothetical protein